MGFVNAVLENTSCGTEQSLSQLFPLEDTPHNKMPYQIIIVSRILRLFFFVHFNQTIILLKEKERERRKKKHRMTQFVLKTHIPTDSFRNGH